VGIFVSLRRHSPSLRVRLWIFSWALIFVHFFVQIFEVEGRTGTLEAVFDSLDLGALELSGVVFLISLTMSVEHRLRRSVLFAIIGAPVLFHSVATSFDWHLRWTLTACVALIFFGGAAYPHFVRREWSAFRLSTTFVVFLAGIWSVRAQLRGDPNPAITSVLALTLGLSGVLFWRRMRRWSPGVLTVVGGFLAWGVVFPAGTLTDALLPNLKINPEIWNVPKFFVAFGMILSILEDKSCIIEESSARERVENAMLRRFSKVTSQLLTASEPTELCGELCRAITQTSSFISAAVLLTNRDASLHVTGSSGLSEEQGRRLHERIRGLGAPALQHLSKTAQPCGLHALRLSAQFFQMAREPGAPSSAVGSALGSEILIPLPSSRGAILGWLVLASPQDAALVGEAQLNKVEMLATDLAVTIENTRLHGQLARTEKLAALGRLVAGVAHELNNPLTGIIGYSDLLTEELLRHPATKRVEKLNSEARRMKRIVDGLLRFARQNQVQDRTTSLELALQDAVLLREYSLRARGVAVRTQIEPDLPEVAIGADELKQVLLNLLSNALDAVEDSVEKSILIQVTRGADRVELCIQDSGPGFIDLDRACDPFYTTKPPGKGTGLGLSICYGLIQQCGGELHLANKEPHGASVTVTLPIPAAAAPSAANASITSASA
jgi:signal transduction histidine kinase